MPSMPPIRPKRPDSSWYSPNHRARKLSAEPPVTSAQPLWRLVKDGHVAEARVRRIEGVVTIGFGGHDWHIHGDLPAASYSFV